MNTGAPGRSSFLMTPGHHDTVARPSPGGAAEFSSGRARANQGVSDLKRFPLAAPAALTMVLTLSAGLASPFALCDDPSAFSGSRSPAWSAPEGSRSPHIAVLTIDAAWSTEGAVGILDLLDGRGVKATFFLAGRFVEDHPDIARRIAIAGHEVGNHTFNHAHLTGRQGRARSARSLMSREVFLEEMEATRRIWEAATGSTLAPLWRAPYGEINREILGWAADLGYAHVGWSAGFDTLDWVNDHSSSLYRSSPSALASILRRLAARRAADGPAFILMHLGSTRPPDERFAEALPALIDGARDLGYRFVTAGEALEESPFR